jgi:hypothetical protein
MSEKNNGIMIGACPDCGGLAQLVGDENHLDYVIHLPPQPCKQRTVQHAYLELKSRLEEMEKAEPVAWGWFDCEGFFKAYESEDEAKGAVEQLGQVGDYAVPLYSHPPAPTAVPDGYVLMPANHLPKEMEAAAVEAAREYMQRTGGNCMKTIYKALVNHAKDAAPAPAEAADALIKRAEEEIQFLMLAADQYEEMEDFELSKESVRLVSIIRDLVIALRRAAPDPGIEGSAGGQSQ